MQCGAMSGLVFCVAKLLSSQDIFHFTLTYNDITHHQSHTLCLSMLWVTFRNDTVFFVVARFLLLIILPLQSSVSRRTLLESRQFVFCYVCAVFLYAMYDVLALPMNSNSCIVKCAMKQSS